VVRIILKGSRQISPDDFVSYYQTIEIDSSELEQKMSEMGVVGSEVTLKPPTTSNSN
jgi:hypothetical protein